MDSDNGGQVLDSQRRAAAEIARRRVLAAYGKTVAEEPNITSGASAYAAPNNAHMKEEPLNSKINSESWKRYHSEWQNYYQKYYSNYYSNAAKQYIAKERLKDTRSQAEEDDIVYALAHAGGREKPVEGLKLRDDIRRKATDSAKKTRKLRKFIPIMAGATVTLLILFLQYNRLIFAPIYAYVSPGNAPASEIEALDPTITQTVSADPRLIIPKLNIDVPIRFGVPLSGVMEAMNNGVAHYRIAGASAYPGEVGNFIITGHSAGDIYSANPYKYIFSGLERLENGDLIYVNYESVRYTYQVVNKTVVEPSDVEALVVSTNKPLITLVTCTPLGTSRYRLLVTGEQISPDYDGSNKQDSTATEDTPSIALPSNEPSFFENIWNFLTGQ
jgi:sortase A